MNISDKSFGCLDIDDVIMLSPDTVSNNDTTHDEIELSENISKVNGVHSKECEIPSWIDEDMIFPIQSITFKDIIGQGNFGVIRKALIKQGRAVYPVALKSTRHVWDKDTDIPLPYRKDVVALMDEAKTMNTVGKYNDNIVNLQGVCFDKPDGCKLKNVYLILEYCTNGSLKSYLLSHQDEFKVSLDLWKSDTQTSMLDSDEINENHHDQVQLMIWSYQIANGMKFLASKSIYHGDLACRNILLTDELVAKISDFGLSRRLYDKFSASLDDDADFSMYWSSIEVLRMENYSVQSDIWSFGVVLWEIFQLGKEPYPKGLDFVTLEKKLANGYRLGCPKYAPKHISDHMQQCWEENPEKRPTYNTFLETLESLYELKTSYARNVNKDKTCYAYRMKLRYASLAFHEESLEKQFITIRKQNSRTKQSSYDRTDSVRTVPESLKSSKYEEIVDSGSYQKQDSNETQYTPVDQRLMEAYEEARVVVKTECNESKPEMNLDSTNERFSTAKICQKSRNCVLMVFALICAITIAITMSIPLSILHNNDIIWSEWGEWHGCCCYGLHYRTRGCKNRNSSLPCNETEIEREECSMTSGCYEWNSWSSYGTCYNGVQAKSRTCKNANSAFPTCSSQVETRYCRVNYSQETSTILWNKTNENAIIPFIVDKRISDNEGQYKNFTKALNEIYNSTCIRFQPMTESEKYNHYVNFTDSPYCVAGVGRKENTNKTKGETKVRVGGCTSSGMILRAIIRVLGFDNEHQRLDRDEYININYDGITNHEMENYKRVNNRTLKHYLKCDEKKTGCLDTGTPYDCQSISHRKRHIDSAFDTSKKYEIITPTEKLTEFKSCDYGQKTKMSDLDIMDLNIVYGCTKYHNVNHSSFSLNISEYLYILTLLLIMFDNV